MKKTKADKLFRSMTLDRAVDVESRTLEFSFSSEEPYERFDGFEILDHSENAMRMDRLADGAPLLLDHDQSRVIGVIESARIEGRRGIAAVRFGKSALAEEVFQDVQDGIRRNISVGYRVYRAKDETGKDEKTATYRVTDWLPLEVSIVGVPADQTVGIGRSDDGEDEAVEETGKKESEETKTEKVKKMEDQEKRDFAEAKAMAEKAVSAERVRVTTIDKLAEKYQASAALVEEARANDMSVEEFCGRMAQEQPVPQPIGVKPNEIGMSDKEVKNFSFMRAIRALADNNPKGAEFEFECSNAAIEQARRNGHSFRSGSFVVPFDVLSRTVNDSSTHGAELVQTDVLGASFIELLRNKSKVIELGARVLTGLQGDVSIPRQTGSGTAYWLSDDGTDITSEGALALDSVSLTPKNLGAYTDITRQMMIQSSVGLEQLVRADLAAVLALAVDLAALNGSSSLAYTPTGILNTSSVNSITAGSAALDFADVVGFETEISTDNADVSAMKFLTNAKVRGKMKQTLSSTTAAGAEYLWKDNMVNGYPAFVSNQLAVGTSNAAIFGDWSQLLIGMWGNGLELNTDKAALALQGGTRVIALMTCDVAVRHPQAFSKCEDIVTT